MKTSDRIQTGNDDSDTSRDEANRIIELLEPVRERLDAREEDFVSNCEDPLERITPKRLFWLRDLLARYVQEV